jgi:hypothetical protein
MVQKCGKFLPEKINKILSIEMDVLQRSARKSRMERIKNEHIKKSEREAGHHRHHREEKTTVVWPCLKDARGENTKINYGLDTRGRPRKTLMEGVQAAMTAINLEQDQWRNREEWRLVSGRRRQLL